MRILVSSILLLGVLVGCNRVPGDLSEQTEGLYLPGQIPIGLPAPPRSTDREITPALVSLGRQLFFEPRLSAGGRRACADCHDPMHAFCDGLPAPAGVADRPRNTPSLLNVVYRPCFGVDGATATLEDRIRLELTDPRMMGLDPESVERALSAIDGYRRQFEQALGEVSFDGAASALAAFSSTLLSGASPLDLLRLGRGEALTEPQRRGLMLFEGKARCVACHRGAMLSDGLFHNIGVGMDRVAPDRGRALVTGRPADVGAFRTPSLRDVAETAPYMHDGSLTSLMEVVAFYDRGGVINPDLDRAIEPLALTDAEQQDLVAFLHALSGQRPTVTEGRRPE